MARRFGQAAMLAAILVLTMNSARAETPSAKSACPDCCCKAKPCCKAEKSVCPDCCKDESCCKSAKTACKCAACAKESKCCTDGTCCKDGKCCKEAACCKSGKCCKDGTCCKGGKCCNGAGCCKAAACCKGKDCCKGACGADCGCCCGSKGKHVKKAAVAGPIIVLMPMPMSMPMPMMPPGVPVSTGCPAGCATMPVPMPPPPGLAPPVMPPQTVSLPVPPPCPAYGPPPPYPTPVYVSQPIPMAGRHCREDGSIDPGLAILGLVGDLCACQLHSSPLSAMCMLGLGMVEDVCSALTSSGRPQDSRAGGGYDSAPQVQPCPLPAPPAACPVAILPPPIPADNPLGILPTAPMVTCSAASPAPAATKLCITATRDSDQLQMTVGDDACLSCKKMTVKVGACSLTLTRLDDRVRIRTDDLRAKANCVRTDRKDRLILQGDVELHINKDGQSARVTAERIELNLASGAVTIQSMGLERIGVNFAR